MTRDTHNAMHTTLLAALAVLTLAVAASCGGGFDPSNVKAPAVLILQDDTGPPFECVNVDGDDILIVRPRRLGDMSLADLLATTDCKDLELVP